MTPTTPPQVWGLPRWVTVVTAAAGVSAFCAGAVLRLRQDPDAFGWVVAVVGAALAGWLAVLLVRLVRSSRWPLPLSIGLLWLGLGLGQLIGSPSLLTGPARTATFAVSLTAIVASIVATVAESRARAAAGAER